MKTNSSKDKLRGGYYTPAEIADFLTNWAITSPNDTVLEPSCGDGNILHAAVKTLHQLGAKSEDISKNLYFSELDADEFAKAKNRLLDDGVKTSSATSRQGDFFSYCHQLLNSKKRFDVVVGNPPFIRYQNFPDEYREIAFSLMKNYGFKPNKLTNIWVPFLVLSSHLLSENGRLAMVIPAELFQVSYAAETRLFLSDFYSKINIITFRELVFDGLLQEVVLILAQRNQVTNKGIRTVEVTDRSDLKKLTGQYIDSQEIKLLDHSKEKWIKYFLNSHEISLLREVREYSSITELKEIIEIDVGVVTGQNQFFVMNGDSADQWNLSGLLTPIVTRSNQLSGIKYCEDDWHRHLDDGKNVYLLKLPNVPFYELPEAACKYIEHGEKNNFHTGYKCRIRKNWHYVPSIWTPAIFALRQVHEFPKLIVNATEATCTDTVHRGRVSEGIDPHKLCGSFINSLTFACSEVTGRSYGGGVMTFEPSEVEKLLLPTANWDDINPEWIDEQLRQGNILNVLERNDEILLRRGLNMSEEKIMTLRKIWMKLRDRRIGRN